MMAKVFSNILLASMNVTFIVIGIISYVSLLAEFVEYPYIFAIITTGLCITISPLVEKLIKTNVLASKLKIIPAITCAIGITSYYIFISRLDGGNPGNIFYSPVKGYHLMNELFTVIFTLSIILLTIFIKKLVIENNEIPTKSFFTLFIFATLFLISALIWYDYINIKPDI